MRGERRGERRGEMRALHRACEPLRARGVPRGCGCAWVRGARAGVRVRACRAVPCPCAVVSNEMPCAKKKRKKKPNRVRVVCRRYSHRHRSRVDALSLTVQYARSKGPVSHAPHECTADWDHSA